MNRLTDGRIEWEEPEEVENKEWNKEFLEAWRKDLLQNMNVVSLLQSDPDAELKLNRNKMFWDGNQWIVLGQKRRNADYKMVLYEGTDEVEAVKALRGENNG